MKSANGLKPRPPDRDIQSNISQHSCLQHAARVWPCCCDLLDVDSSLTIFKLELHSTFRKKPSRSKQGSQTLATFSTVLPQQYCDMLRWNVAIRLSGLNPYSLGGPFCSPQASSEFDSKMALAWLNCACSPKYTLTTGYGVYGCWIKLRRVPRSLFTKSSFFTNQWHQFATTNEFHHEKQPILKKNCYNPVDALI